MASVRLEERREDRRELIRGDPDARVRDAEIHPLRIATKELRRRIRVTRSSRLDRYSAARLTELDGVRDDVQQYLPDSILVTEVHGRAVQDAANDERNTALLDLRLDERHRRIHRASHVVRIVAHGESPGLDLRQIEHFVHEAEQVATAGRYPLDLLPLLGVEASGKAEIQQLGVPQN